MIALEESPKAEATVPAYVACLYIANIRKDRAQVVYGGSGKKYAFKYSKAHDKLIREYESKDVFQREELDIRRNVKNPFHVCTMLGALDPVGAAVEAVDALIEERMRVAGHVKREALLKLANKIELAVSRLFPDSADPFSRGVAEERPQPSASLPPQEPPALEHPSSIAAGTTAIQPGSPESPVPDTEGTKEEGSRAFGDHADPIPKYKNRDLMRMPINDLRDLGKRHGLTTTDRDELRKQILELQDSAPCP